MRHPLFAACSLLTLSLGSPSFSIDRDKIIDSLNKIASQQSVIDSEVLKIRTLLHEITDVTNAPPLLPNESMDAKITIRTEDGIKAYEAKDYAEAKEFFREAWELLPNSYITNFNLALAYKQLDNLPLAKKLFTTALEINKIFPGSEQANAFIDPNYERKVSEPQTSSLSQAEEMLAIELHNLQQEYGSYMRSEVLTYPEKMRESVTVLNLMIEKAKEHPFLKREYFLSISDAFAAFQLYAEALQTMKSYETAMEGTLLPEDFYSKLLNYEEKRNAQMKLTAKYSGNHPSKDIETKLNRDLEELGIFSDQLEHFVQTTNKEDSDFAKLCERLGEYRWGNQEGRLVMVVDRYQDLLYSSLEGTLPIARYQDDNGQTFFKNLTFLADDPNLLKPEFFDVTLRVKNQLVPYVVMYSYIPKHQSFIIVRLPRKDLLHEGALASHN